MPIVPDITGQMIDFETGQPVPWSLTDEARQADQLIEQLNSDPDLGSYRKGHEAEEFIRHAEEVKTLLDCHKGASSWVSDPDAISSDLRPPEHAELQPVPVDPHSGPSSWVTDPDATTGGYPDPGYPHLQDRS